MKKIIILLSFFVFAFCLFAQAADSIILFKEGTSKQQRRETVEKLGLKATRDLPEIFATVVKLPGAPGQVALPLAQIKQNFPLVEHVEDDARISAIAGEGFNTSVAHALKNSKAQAPTNFTIEQIVSNAQRMPWGIEKTGAPKAWSQRFKGRGVVVAVIDTGIELSHPDLRENILGGYNTFDSSQPPADGNGHGTHVAGIIAAADNGFGVVGVAPEAKLLAVKAVDDKGISSHSHIATGILWAAKKRADVINISLTYGKESMAVTRALNYAGANRITVVAAAGNKGAASLPYPAKYKNVISVGASDAQGKVARFSNYGEGLDFVAPGVNVASTFINGQYKVKSGTSMAAPHVAGLAALAVEAGAKNQGEVMRVLSRAAQPLKGASYSEQGKGFVNASGLF